MKFLRVAFVLAIALCLTASVYAETQSVKVSGDLTIRGLARSGYDGRNVTPKDDGVKDGMTPDTTNMTGGPTPGSGQTFWMSTAEIQVDAELTDNVSTVIRIFNERDWNVSQKGIAAGDAPGNDGVNFYNENIDEFNVSLDLAYVTLKNFVYCPLTVTIGRQDLWFGKGFIVGSNQINNNWVSQEDGWGLNAPEYTVQDAFDSIKAVLDYDPWTITGVWSSVWNNAVHDDDGVDLWGINVGYKFDCYKAEAEAYWFLKRDRMIPSFSGMSDYGGNDVNTIGIRGSMDPIDCVTLNGEIAGQFGSYMANTMQTVSRSRAAWALDVSAEYRGLMDCWAWKPKGAVEYILYSGDNGSVDLPNEQSTYNGWDRMFRGKYDSAIREWMGTYYANYDYQPRPNNAQVSADASYTNQSQLIFSGSLQPMDCLTLKGNWNLFWTLEKYSIEDLSVPGGIPNRDGPNSGFIGQEVDLQAIWDYTEDVSFGLLMAYYMPNYDCYQDGADSASDIVGTVKVSF